MESEGWEALLRSARSSVDAWLASLHAEPFEVVQGLLGDLFMTAALVLLWMGFCRAAEAASNSRRIMLELERLRAEKEAQW